MAGPLARRHTVHVMNRRGEGGRWREGGASHNDTMRKMSLHSSSPCTHGHRARERRRGEGPEPWRTRSLWSFGSSLTLRGGGAR